MDTALDWFKSYLQTRLFKVKVGEAYSSERSLTYSVPQGSCAGANLFNLYWSPLGDAIPPNLSLSDFADDHSIRTQFHADNRPDELQCKDQIEKAMVTTKNWMDSMWLKMNPHQDRVYIFWTPLTAKKMQQKIHKCSRRWDWMIPLNKIFRSTLRWRAYIEEACGSKVQVGDEQPS